MKKSSRSNVRSMAGRFMMGLVMVLMIGGINATPAFSRDHDKHYENHGGRYEHRGRGNDRYQHDRRGNSRARYEHERRGYRSYGYWERGYYHDPSPVIFIPPPPPGIGIFFPPIIIQP